jgi:hypothetical protein
MTQVTTDADAPETPDAVGSVTPTPASRTDLASLPTDVRELIDSLRSEAKQNRLNAKAAEKRTESEATARLEANKEWEQAASTYKKQVEALAPRAERLDAMEQFVRESAQKRIDQLPKQFRSLVPDYDDPLKTLAWLDANAGTLHLPAVPNTGAGEQGDGAGAVAVKLNAEELSLAKQSGMTPEQFAEYKQRRKPEGAK